MCNDEATLVAMRSAGALRDAKLAPRIATLRILARTAMHMKSIA